MLKQVMAIRFMTILLNILCFALFEKNVGVSSVSVEILIKRVPRQDPIVQPDWVPDSGINIFEDFNVKVTDKNLEETEAIRDYIHETVDNGTYVVELNEEDFEEDNSNPDAKESPIEDLPMQVPELRDERVAPPSPPTIVKPQQTDPQNTAIKSKAQSKPQSSSDRRSIFTWLRRRTNKNKGKF